MRSAIRIALWTLVLFWGYATFAQSQQATVPLSIKIVQHQVQLTWVASTHCIDGSACTPTGYNVYRSSTSGTGYGKIASTTTALTYTDSTVLKGQTWYYVVTAYAPACTQPPAPPVSPCGESAYSNIVTAVIPMP
jgi:fibronectin type 3 domain-containing protein